MKIEVTGQNANQFRSKDKLNLSPNVTFQAPPDISAAFAKLTGNLGEAVGKYANAQLKIKNRTQIETEKQNMDNSAEIFKQNFLRQAKETAAISVDNIINGQFAIDPNEVVRKYDKAYKKELLEVEKKVKKQSWAEHGAKLELSYIQGRNKIIENSTQQIRNNSIVTTDVALRNFKSTAYNTKTLELLEANSISMYNYLQINESVFKPKRYIEIQKEIEDTYLENHLRIVVGSTNPQDQLDYLLGNGELKDFRQSKVNPSDDRYKKLIKEAQENLAIYNKGKDEVTKKATENAGIKINKTLSLHIGSPNVVEVKLVQNNLKKEIRDNETIKIADKNAMYAQIDNFYKNTVDNDRMVEYWTLVAQGGGIKGSLLNDFNNYSSVYMTASTRASILAINTENVKQFNANENLIFKRGIKLILDKLGGDENIMSSINLRTDENSKKGTSTTLTSPLLLLGKNPTQGQINAVNILQKEIIKARNAGLDINRLLTTKQDFLGTKNNVSLIDAIVQLSREDVFENETTLLDIVNSSPQSKEYQNLVNSALQNQEAKGAKNIISTQSIDGETKYFRLDINPNKEITDVTPIDLTNTLLRNSSDKRQALNKKRDNETPEQHIDRIAFYSLLERLERKGIKLTDEKIQEYAKLLNFDVLEEIQRKDFDEFLKTNPEFEGLTKEEIDSQLLGREID
tara:strand:- start:9262 stop:11316 length:2055 start_codon:yes stop_codon:yes gene_type:complete